MAEVPGSRLARWPGLTPLKIVEPSAAGNKSGPVISESVTRLVEEFAKLPGIGRKSAERLAYHVLRIHKNEAMALADAIRSVKDNVRYCRVCYNLAEAEECSVCRDAKR